MTSLQIYLLLCLDGLKDVALLAFMASLMTTLGSGLIWGLCGLRDEGYSEDNKTDVTIFKKTMKKAFVVMVISLLLCDFVPGSKEMAAIIYAPKIINNTEVKQIPNKVLKLANEWLDELAPDNKK